MGTDLNLAFNPVTSDTPLAIYLDAVSISVACESKIHAYKTLDLPEEFETRIVRPFVQFKKNGIASVSGGSLITNGKRLFYHSIGKQYPAKRRRHHNLLTSGDKVILRSRSGGIPYLYQNQLLITLIDVIVAQVFFKEMDLRVIDKNMHQDAFGCGCFATKVFPPRINHLEYFIEFSFQSRPDIQLWYIANAISEIYGENKAIYGHPGNFRDIRWTVPAPANLSGTESIQIKAYAKDFPDELNNLEQVFRIEVRIVNPRVVPNESGFARSLGEQIHAISEGAVSILTKIYQRCQVPRKMYGFKEIESAVLAVLHRSRNDRRILALIESLMECGSYTPSLHKVHRVPAYHLRKLVSAGLLRPVLISKQRKSYVFVGDGGREELGQNSP